MNNIMKLTLSLITSAVVFGAFVLWVGPENLINRIATIDLTYLPFLVVLLFAQLALSAANIWMLSRGFTKISYKKSFEINLFSWVSGFFAPGKIGQLSQIYLLKKNGLTVGQATALTVTDKIISLFTLGFFGILAAFLFFPELWLQITVFTSVLLCLPVLLLFSAKGREIIKKYVLRKYAGIFAGFSVAIKGILAKKIVLAADLVFTVARVALNALFIMTIILALGGNVNLIVILLIDSLAQLLAYMPISFNGLGIREGGFTVMASYIGIEKTLALSAISISTVIDYLAAGLVTAFFSGKIVGRVPEIKKLGRKLSEERNI